MTMIMCVRAHEEEKEKKEEDKKPVKGRVGRAGRMRKEVGTFSRISSARWHNGSASLYLPRLPYSTARLLSVAATCKEGQPPSHTSSAKAEPPNGSAGKRLVAKPLDLNSQGTGRTVSSMLVVLRPLDNSPTHDTPTPVITSKRT